MNEVYGEAMDDRRINSGRHPLLGNGSLACRTWILSAGLVGDEGESVNYYKRHIGDYARKTAHLSFLEDAAYNRLIDIYYDREAPIPDAQAERLCRASSVAEKKAVRQVLEEFFELRDGAWFHDRCDKEIAKLQGQADANRVNGKKGGRPRKVTELDIENEPNENPLGFNSFSEKNLTPRLQDSKTSKSGFAAPADGNSDPRKALFDLGKNILGPTSGGLISKAIARTSETKVGEVLGHMALSAKADPRAYFEAATQVAEKRVAV